MSSRAAGVLLLGLTAFVPACAGDDTDPERILFDFADLESYDPDGYYYLDLGANDNCDYEGGNWAEQWCTDHAEDPLCASCSCAHSQALNCNVKARAFWWLLGKIAGCV